MFERLRYFIDQKRSRKRRRQELSVDVSQVANMGSVRRNNSERSTVHYTRFLNVDGSYEDVRDGLEGEGLATPMFDFNMSSERRHLEKAQGRTYERIYSIDGINGRKFQTIKIGGNGWTIGIQSVIQEIEGPDVGKVYKVDLAGGITFRGEEPINIDEFKSERG